MGVGLLYSLFVLSYLDQSISDAMTKCSSLDQALYIYNILTPTAKDGSSLFGYFYVWIITSFMHRNDYI